MASSELIAQWEKTEGHIRLAMKLLGDAMAPSDQAGIDMYLGHNELELALTTFIGVAREDGWKINDAAGAELDKAAALMNEDIGQWR